MLSVIWEAILIVVLLQIPQARGALHPVIPTVGDVEWVAATVAFAFACIEVLKHRFGDYRHMCDNCLVSYEEECTCPKGKSITHCSCDPYFNEPCEACGHDPWTKDRSRPGVGKRIERPAHRQSSH